MVSSLLGAGAALATTFIPNFKIWNIGNLDTKKVLQGQFEPVGLTRDNVGANWGQHTSLNRQNAILQFLNGKQETLAFQGRFFRNNALGLDVQGAVFGGNLIDNTPEQKFEVLRSWAKVDSALRRPPILQFWVGDGHVRMNCVMNLSGVKYGRPDAFGGLRDVTFTVNLLEFTSFSLDDEEETDTRFARAKERDYYELLAFQEYGDPLRGDVIRKLHPQQQNLKQGDTVRLPAIEGIRTEVVEQKSIPLQTGFGRKDTAQRRLRIEFFNKRSTSFVSHVLQPSTTPERR